MTKRLAARQYAAKARVISRPDFRPLLVRVLVTSLLALFIWMAMQAHARPPYRDESIKQKELDEKPGMAPDMDRPEKGIIIEEKDSELEVKIWTDLPRYKVGKSIRIFFNVNQDAYVYIFNVDSQGRTIQLFPNYYDKANYLRANTNYSIPTQDYNLRVAGPTGREQLEIIAVTNRPGYTTYFQDYHTFQKADPYPQRPQGAQGMMQRLERIEREGVRDSEHIRIQSGRKSNDGPDIGHLNIPGPDQQQGKNKGKELGRKKPDTGMHVTEKDDDGIVIIEEEDEETGDAGIVIVERDTYTPPAHQTARDEAYFYVIDEYPANRMGQLKVSTQPGNARVFIDGKFIGNSPQTVRLSYGRHEVVAKKAGYYDTTYPVNIQSTLQTPILVILRPKHREPISINPPKMEDLPRR
ncbi:MAG: DUF4384 domain-containing protein [Candidatus Sumerlaeia bacterium]